MITAALPSNTLDAIAAGLRTALTFESQPSPVRVEVIDDTALADITEYATLPVPSILITAVGLVATDDDPGMAELSLIARCLADVSVKPEAAGQVIRSRGDVAMNLAAFVVRQLDGNPKWLDAAGKDLAVTRPKRIQARNLGGRALSQRGRSMWVVSWQQVFKLGAELDAAVFHALKHLHLDTTLGPRTEEPRAPFPTADLDLEGAELP